MVFITRFSAKLARLVRLLAVATVLLAASHGNASGIETQKAVAIFSENSIEISSRFSITLSPALEQALQNGLVLPFQLEFQLTRPRLQAWTRQLSNWFGPTEIMNLRLSYQSLTHQYRVSSGGLSRSFTSLGEALSALGIASGWKILPGSSLAEDANDFAGRLRLRLDLSKLPKPYQLAAIGQPDRHLESRWADLTVRVAEAEEQP